MDQNQVQRLTNFLVLNSLDFFERSLLLMGKHDQISLYLSSDETSRNYVKLAKKRSLKFYDASKFYKRYKNLNDWIINSEELQKPGLLHKGYL